MPARTEATFPEGSHASEHAEKIDNFFASCARWYNWCMCSAPMFAGRASSSVGHQESTLCVPLGRGAVHQSHSQP